jgi:MFS transporter, DHA1 family, tetracycline resistance protein
MGRRAILSITLLDNIGFTIGFPILTFLCFDNASTLFPLAATHATRSFWYGIFNALPHVVAIFFVPILSLLSDHFGRKKIIFLSALGVFMFSIFTALSIFSGVLGLLLLGCIIAGILTRTQPVAQAIIADISEPHNLVRNMGYLQFSIAAGAFLGPLIGGYFARRFFFSLFNFSLPYLFGAVFSFIAIVIAVKFLPETNPTSKISANKAQRKIKFRVNYFISELREILSRKVLIVSLLLLLSQISWRIYYQFIPPVLKLNFNFDVTLVGVFISLIAVWLCFASSLGVKVLERFFSAGQIIVFCSWMLFVGLLITVAGSLLAPHKLGQILIWISALPIAVGDVILFSVICALYSKAVNSESQGKIMGLCFVIVSVVWALTGFLGGFLTGINVNLPIILSPIAILISICCIRKSVVCKA